MLTLISDMNVTVLAVKNHIPALLWWIRSIYLQATWWGV